MFSRRRFLRYSAAAGTGICLSGGWTLRRAYGQPGSLLDPYLQPKFINPVPNPLAPSFIFQPHGGYKYKIGMHPIIQQLGLIDPSSGTPLATHLWGYGDNRHTATFPGRTFQVQRDVPVEVRWTNGLRSGKPVEHLMPVDESLHYVYTHPPYDQYDIDKDGVPVVPHLHGGHTESDSDGLPEYWFTPNFQTVGPRWVKDRYIYDNDQEAGTLWYHDHALGITRLNVYAGLAGFYIVRDAFDTGRADNPFGLPAYPYEVPLVVQDRMFDHEASLFLPVDTSAGLPQRSIVAEFFGDHILVNGVAWPKMDVEPRKYRLRLLNGSDSRFYVLRFRPEGAMGSPLPFHQIGTDQGFLPQAVALTGLVLGPGERADLVVDFADAALANRRIVLENVGPDDPFRGLNGDGSNNDGEGGSLPPADPLSTGLIMAFDVSLPLSPVPDAFDPTTQLRAAPYAVPGPVARTRQLVLFEGEDQYGRLRPQLGTYDPSSPLDGSLLWDEPITENPGLGDVEIWEIFNATEDAHPIHLHLVSFEILDRQHFDGESLTIGQDPLVGGTKQVLDFEGLEGPAFDPPANEAGGPKDTAQMYPEQVTRIKAKFDRPGRYVWHCHILSHEDHEMMRPYQVG